ncbi:tetracenomycin polyketide synthesis O-methyltransferase TcmP [Apiospora arundinis]
MNALLSPQPSFLPHQHNATTRRSPTRSMSPFQHGNMSTNRKRKAEDDGDEMSVSPMSSPAIQSRQLSRPSKKSRANEIAGRPLTLPRLLETLDAASLRMVLQKICERQPEIGEEVVKGAPKPSVQNALQVLEEYQEKMRAAFPYGNSSSDYVYNRVKAPMAALMDALADFTPQYLPPERDPGQCFPAENAYDEISRAWALVINEAAKRGGGFVLHSGGWDQIVTKHNQQSGGRMGTAMSAMAENVGWVGGGPSGAPQEQQQQHSILNELLSGNYGAPVRVGPW